MDADFLFQTLFFQFFIQRLTNLLGLLLNAARRVAQCNLKLNLGHSCFPFYSHLSGPFRLSQSPHHIPAGPILNFAFQAFSEQSA